MPFRRFASRLARGLSILAIAAAPALASTPSQADAGFQRWIKDFRSVALRNGIRAATYDHAFKGVKDPDPEVLRKANNQAEFKAPVWQYIDNQVNEDTVAMGRAMQRKYGSVLSRIEQRFGVPGEVVLAIWSIESQYGEYLKKKDRLHYAPQALATLAYADRRRRKFARGQLIAALKILQSGNIDRGHLASSWAGAMGHTQFIPTSYLAYAVDFDGDGKKDIWNSVPDALATAANLLKRNGWETGRTWGYEVVLPSNGKKFYGGWQSLSAWEQSGVRRTHGRKFTINDKAELKVPDGRSGPTFLVVKNFEVLKRYNNADKYALSVALLSDRLAGYDELLADWNRPFEPLNSKEKRELQSHLARHGLYDGAIDGKIGGGTMGAITAFQSRAGLTVNGFPSMEVLNKLRR
ncbi:lytic murein transglycosylase [Notoacmeibacter sp. MSK16QG-6]|uniref:lytic murein transglycosylase n=1 Tax=Notoacmeibacter sp. MSK16QG-6 TaxID=2957982 RepID=UPI0020A12F2A|nr:lytic murein transglycosylase [Notoacmeibacter sp. MSK16QG-6]MCP1200365.1 lytic murein transglycosylase [Notoacmeibacter sp. MSK16QG-6]